MQTGQIEIFAGRLRPVRDVLDMLNLQGFRQMESVAWVE
jgi:hypothetical protein